MDITKPYKFIPKDIIEMWANRIRSQVKDQRCRRPLKNCDVAEAVADHFDLSIEWAGIEPDQEGEIAAMIIPIQKLIVINEDVQFLRNTQNSKTSKEGFKNSTLAHEIGHWVLHINQKAISNFLDRIENGQLLEVQHFLCRTVNSNQNIEWQAQYFASCLLMPVTELKKSSKGRNLTNLRHLYAMADELGVTISNLKNRLVGLEWIRCGKNTKVIYRGNLFPLLK